MLIEHPIAQFEFKQMSAKEVVAAKRQGEFRNLVAIILAGFYANPKMCYWSDRTVSERDDEMLTNACIIAGSIMTLRYEG